MEKINFENSKIITMKKDTKTKVIFYKELGGILAVFPKEKEFNGYGINNACYSHVGQHSVSNKGYHSKLNKATREEYADLAKELESIGYNLEILNERKRPIDKILEKVDCKYGAPMGRDSYGVKPTDQKVFTHAVPLTEGYDNGGAYWGYPSNLRVEYTKDLSYIKFYRTN